MSNWVVWKGPEVEATLHRLAVVASKRGAEFLLRASNRTIPTNPGLALERSGKVTTDDRTSTSAVSYDTDYAVLQHERQDWHHEAGERAKFLEQAMTESRPEIARVVRGAMKL